MKEEFVIKSNDIIRNFRYDYTEKELKAIAYICAIYKAHEHEVETIETFRFSFLIKDFIEACGSSDFSGNAYNEVRKLISTLEKKSEWISVFSTNNKEMFTSVSWIAKSYFDKRDRVEFYADRDLYWYICGLTERYTAYELVNIMKMHGKHALRMYELLKSYEFCKSYTVDISELKFLLAVDGKKKYENNSHFISEIIAPAVKEINDKTDLIITYETIHTGRKISDLFFKIRTNKKVKKGA